MNQDDIEFALVLDVPGQETRKSTPDSPAAPATPADDTSRTTMDSWLSLVEGFARRLYSPACDPADALSYLFDTLGAAGSCVAEWIGDGNPVVVAARGNLGDVPPSSELDKLVAPPHSCTPQGTVLFRTDAAGTVACLSGHEGPPLFMLIYGDFVGRAESESLLRTLLRLLDRTRPWAAHRTTSEATEVARADHPALALPDGHVPRTSPAMTALYRQMQTLLKNDAPILITGETGVGKEGVATMLHHASNRRGGPLVAINCAAIPADLLEAELFGIGKGVATGVDKREGKFQLAAGGTIFLDEIGELPPALQAKLLRVLQEKQVQPLGERPRSIDIRIVAATNADLDRRMADGLFRSDLYYRLAGYVLEVPPLRECREDVPPLVDYFLRIAALETGIHPCGVTVKALRLLTAYSWPGNVRELQHEIRRLSYVCPDGGAINARMLSSRIASAAPSELAATMDPASGVLQLAPRLRQLEVLLIREALRHSAGRQGRAAKLLGISRNGLADKIKRLSIDLAAFRS